MAQGLLFSHILCLGRATCPGSEWKMEQLLPRREPPASSFALEKL